MAVSARLLQLSGLKQLAAEGQDINLMDISLRLEEENVINKVQNKLIEQIAQAKANEAKFLALFQVNDLEVLQRRFDSFLAFSGFNKLTGPQLHSTVLSQYKYKKTGEYDFAHDEEFKQWVQNVYLPEIVERVLQIDFPIEEFAERVCQELISDISSFGGVHQGGSQFYKGNAENARKGDLGQILIEKLNKNRLDKLGKLYQNRTKKTTSSDAEIKFQSSSSLNGQEIFSVEGKVDYYAATKGMKKSELNSLTEEEFKKAKQDLKEILSQDLSMMVPSLEGQNTALSKQLIYTILNNNDKILESFFVGKNYNDITGILWELTAAIALQELLPQSNIDNILWTAKEIKDGKQLSTDFIIKFLNGTGVGIQIKNSSQDLEALESTKPYEIGFVDADINLIFDRLGEKFPYFKKNSSTIQDIYISDTFNVPYDYNNETRTYFETQGSKLKGFGEFTSTKGELNSLKNKIDNFFKTFSADLLFATTGDNFTNSLATLNSNVDKIISGNSIYIIGGKIMFVSTILSSILNDLNKLQISVKMKKVDSEELGEQASGNIVDYKNIYGWMGKTNRKTWEKIKQNLNNQNYQFTSSYLFS